MEKLKEARCFDPPTFCDECGTVAEKENWHCDICFSGDFDLCPDCYAEGIHCLVPNHQLLRRTQANLPRTYGVMCPRPVSGGLVTISQ
jgi:next-to-BRCA1 protein 1